MAGIRKQLCFSDNYSLFAAFLKSLARTMGNNSWTQVLPIHPLGRASSSGWFVFDHLIYYTVVVVSVIWSHTRRVGLPRQFGYDQLYVGNPNHHLGYAGSLSDGA